MAGLLFCAFSGGARPTKPPFSLLSRRDLLSSYTGLLFQSRIRGFADLLQGNTYGAAGDTLNATGSRPFLLQLQISS